MARFTEEERVEVWDRWLTNRTKRCSGGSAIAFSANSPMDRLVREKTDAASSIHFVVMLLVPCSAPRDPKHSNSYGIIGVGIDCTVLNRNTGYCLQSHGNPDTHPEGNRAETGVPAEEE